MEISILIVGGMIGFLSAVGKDFLLERNKSKAKNKEFKRQKLEEVFILMDQVSQEAIKPLMLKNSTGDSGARIGMIIRFYFPSLTDDYNKFIQVFQSIIPKTLSDNTKLTAEEMETYYEAHQVFQSRVVEESKKYV
jgi:hypothetical protein